MVGGTTFVPNVNPPVVALVNKMRPPPTVTGAAVVDGITIVGGAAGKIYGVGIVVVVVVVVAAVVAVALVVLTMVGPVLVLFGSVVVDSNRGASQEAQAIF